jgi:hypothetical protein
MQNQPYPGAPTVTTGVDRVTILHQLASFCRGEMSAVETYNKAIASCSQPNLVPIFQKNRNSHQMRVEKLSERIRRMGGDVPESAGAWGSFVTLLESAATAIGDNMAVSCLEEGEDHGLRDYHGDRDKLDADTQRFIRDDILPGQIDTHRVMSNLKRSMH